MGSFDIYCIICGNTFNCNDKYIERDIEYLDLNEEEKKSNKYKYNEKNCLKNHDWLKKCTVLLANDTVIHNLAYDDANFYFKINNKLEMYIYNHGLFLHTDCYNYVYKKIGINIIFSNIPNKLLYDTKNKKLSDMIFVILYKINYEDMIMYQE